MFSKEESRKLRQEFWTCFGKSFPKKWTLYHTKIRDFGFKFYFDTKKAMVMLDIEDERLEFRIHYYEKLVVLKAILQDTYLPDIIFEDCFILENGKEISRIYVEKKGVCIHNKNTWQQAMEFLNENMQQFEFFWNEYEDFIKQQ